MIEDVSIQRTHHSTVKSQINQQSLGSSHNAEERNQQIIHPIVTCKEELLIKQIVSRVQGTSHPIFWDVFGFKVGGLLLFGNWVQIQNRP